MKFNIFHGGIKEIKPSGSITIKEFIELIKDDTPSFQKIRESKTKDERNFYKKNLSYVTFGGTFRERGNSNLLVSSGLICLDYDDFESNEEMQNAYGELKNNKFTHLLFISPSGKGFKIVVKIPNIESNEENHLYYNAIARHFNLKRDADASAKDISRACYLSYDPNPYFYEFSDVFKENFKEGRKETLEFSNKKESKNSRSEKEFREVLKLVGKGLSKEEIFEEMEVYAKWSDAHPSYKELTYKKAKEYEEQIQDNKKRKSAFFVFEKEGQALEFIKRQPLFYDKSDMWWLWNKEGSKWEMTDKTQILTSIKNSIGVNVINSKERTEIINALQIVGRENMPEQIPKECIQFKNKIINIKTEGEFSSSPKYFTTNPIPWNIGDSEETPLMDKYFEEWVGKEYVQTLYEIIAYSSSSNQFMQRMFALVGGGCNGKGTFIKLLKKFIGKENCVSSELRVLSENQFATSSIYKKLVCEMGEVSHDDLKNTNQIKKLSGEDDIRFEFKGKTPFSEESPTTCLINTNSLPISKDKTIGFYRRWLIIDFPNQFPIKEGIIESVPDWEFENLAKKSLRLLKKLYKKYEFSNEGNIEERSKRYEERSNPVMRFIEDFCEEDYESYVSLSKFSKNLNDFLKEKHLRTLNSKEIKRILNEEGFSVTRTTKDYKRDFYILNLKIIQNIPIIQEFESQISYEKQNQKNGIIGIIGTKTTISKENQNKINETFDFLDEKN